MSEWSRRSVLATGAALSVGSGLALTSTGTSKSGPLGTDSLPDPDIDPNPGLDEDWYSYRGDAGHARCLEDSRAFDPEALEAAWSADHDGPIAVADETVYTTNGDGVVAIDAADGSIVWENTNTDANRPTVVDETVYLSGNEVVALDRSDGSVRWTTDFDPEEPIDGHTVAYDGVYVVVDGTLYALEADDGSVRWKIESVSAEIEHHGEQEFEFTTSTAAMNGVVYAVTDGVALALEPESGDEVWRAVVGDPMTETFESPRVTTNIAHLGSVSYYARLIHDPITGEMIDRPSGEYLPVMIGEEMYLGGVSHNLNAYFLDESEIRWQVSVHFEVGEAIISPDTVYIYFPEDDRLEAAQDPDKYGYSRELVALDKYDGSEKWSLSKDDAPVGDIRAISGGTIYVSHDGDLVALREPSDDGDEGSNGDGTGDGSNGEAGNGASDGDGTDGDENASGGNDSGDTDGGNETGDGPVGDNGDSGTEDGSDGTPGFTVGGGLLGSVLGLEWLRRQTDPDDSSE